MSDVDYCLGIEDCRERTGWSLPKTCKRGLDTALKPKLKTVSPGRVSDYADLLKTPRAPEGNGPGLIPVHETFTACCRARLPTLAARFLIPCAFTQAMVPKLNWYPNRGRTDLNKVLGDIVLWSY